MINESRTIPHIPCINGALWTTEVIEGVIHTQTFPQKINAMLY